MRGRWLTELCSCSSVGSSRFRPVVSGLKTWPFQSAPLRSTVCMAANALIPPHIRVTLQLIFVYLISVFPLITATIYNTISCLISTASVMNPGTWWLQVPLSQLSNSLNCHQSDRWSGVAAQLWLTQQCSYTIRWVYLFCSSIKCDTVMQHF